MPGAIYNLPTERAPQAYSFAPLVGSGGVGGSWRASLKLGNQHPLTVAPHGCAAHTPWPHALHAQAHSHACMHTPYTQGPKAYSLLEAQCPPSGTGVAMV